jgi:putative SOS response-associated peptidase YedK
MLDWAALLGDWPEEVAESHNIAPGQTVAAFSGEGGHAMRWGLIPPWLDEASSRYATFNARAESVTEKPAYRHAWKQAQRCVMPALGYFEWQKQADGKQPYFIRGDNREPVFFAGLFEPARESIPWSCTMLTRPAREDLASIHPRMPVILSRQSLTRWLEADNDEALALTSDEPGFALVSYPVSRRVNNARNEGDDLIAPDEG